MTTTERTALTEGTVHTVTGGAGRALHVREWGRMDGPAVLLVHGWSGNHLCWHHQVHGRLADDLRLVALDLRGHGDSERPVDPEQYLDGALWADDVAAVLEACHLQLPVLVGWSYGGFVICDYLRRYGDSAISGINFVGAAVTLNDTFDHIGQAFLSTAPVAATGDLPGRIAAIRRFWQSMTEQPLDAADLEAGLCGTASVPPQVLGALISRQIDSDDVLAGLAVPVLVTHGRQDKIVLPSMAEHVLRVCPTARASWYDGVGHAPFMEDQERFDRELHDLVRGRPASSGEPAADR
jgi:pimeloyl-ACP methyl ester carboxylesterase